MNIFFNELLFYNCTKLTGTLTIPNSVTSIGDYAFFGCSGFTGNLTIPNSVTSIGYVAFEGCSGFTGNLTIPNSVTSIVSYAFNGCSGFTGNLTIPNSVISIGEYAFYGCSCFTGNLTIPNSVTSIGEDAFEGCTGLESVNCMPTTPPTLGTTAFPEGLTFRVATGAGDAYRSATNWSNYSNLYEFGDANWSKSLTVTDAVADANYIVGASQAGTFDFDCGDINFSKSITIADAISIIDAVAKYNPSGLTAVTRRAPRMTEGRLVADNFRLDNGSATMGVALDTDRPVVALQADFIAGDGVSIDDITLAPEIAATHSLTVARHDNDGIVRAIIFSAANDVIDTADGALLQLSLSGDGEGDITAVNILASTSDADEFALGAEGGNNLQTLGVDGVGSDNVRVIASGGVVTIINAEGLDVEIYDVSGKLVSVFTAESDSHSCSLTSGFYVVRVNNKSTKIIL